MKNVIITELTPNDLDKSEIMGYLNDEFTKNLSPTFSIIDRLTKGQFIVALCLDTQTNHKHLIAYHARLQHKGVNTYWAYVVYVNHSLPKNTPATLAMLDDFTKDNPLWEQAKQGYYNDLYAPIMNLYASIREQKQYAKLKKIIKKALANNQLISVVLHENVSFGGLKVYGNHTVLKLDGNDLCIRLGNRVAKIQNLHVAKVQNFQDETIWQDEKHAKTIGENATEKLLNSLTQNSLPF